MCNYDLLKSAISCHIGTAMYSIHREENSKRSPRLCGGTMPAIYGAYSTIFGPEYFAHIQRWYFFHIKTPHFHASKSFSEGIPFPPESEFQAQPHLFPSNSYQ